MPDESLLRHLAQALRRGACFTPPPLPARTPVVVAVSGGMDSVTLLHALAQLAPDWCLDLHVAHIDHALRPTSAVDAAFVRDLASQMLTPFHIVRLDGASLHADPRGLEAAARHARYRALCAIACNVTPPELVPVLVVAHHAQDQAETLLLRLVQGSGLTGLAAMRPVTLLDDAALTPRPVRVVRPLLAVTRTELADYARRHQLVWREDESNADTTRSRNLLRHAVLPQLAQINPQVVATLARTAELLVDDADRLDAHDRQALQALTVVQDTVAQDTGRVLLDLTGLQRLPESNRRGVLRAALRLLAADLRTIGAAQVTALAAQLMAAHAGAGAQPLAAGLAWSIVTVDGVRCLALHRHDALPVAPPGPWLDPGWRRCHGRVPVSSVVEVAPWRLTSQPIDRSALSSAWRHNADRWTAYFDADAVRSLVLTTPQPGDRIAPLGLAGKRKSVGDLFTDAKIAPALRPGWPVIVDAASGDLLWVCGLAQSHAARITAQTRRILVLTWTQSGTPTVREGPTRS
jgi:tRNA(Ile)-lysidine synthase